MDDWEQAHAYHKADFERSHGQRVELVRSFFPSLRLTGTVLDLGCGSGDVLFRFARAYPKASFLGVDGSQPMIDLARKEIETHPELNSHVDFLVTTLPSDAIPQQPYDLVMSHSLLHHLHNPVVLWDCIESLAVLGTKICVVDLKRPESAETARAIVDALAIGEPEILRRDFFNSLCAAFTAAEVEEQLQGTGISGLSVREVGDMYLAIYGERAIE
ncbi:trans-aconitate 2-methyltransferase [Synechococcus sp. PCC 7336]|uniref:class I SAM-dependent methyltransferase n=1 Tax=Synechococcus sp. PCC 7336 TaxID=195250 RepID=UPI0003777456|nr:class I SAM-dependent methyltransferase [Synechococcus sp. PCC 7336]